MGNSPSIEASKTVTTTIRNTETGEPRVNFQEFALNGNFGGAVSGVQSYSTDADQLPFSFGKVTKSWSIPGGQSAYQCPVKIKGLSSEMIVDAVRTAIEDWNSETAHGDLDVLEVSYSPGLPLITEPHLTFTIESDDDETGKVEGWIKDARGLLCQAAVVTGT